MQITSEVVEPRQVRLTIVIPQTRIDRAVSGVASDYSRRYKIPGYRPGKAPVQAVAARVGFESLKEEAVDRIAREAVKEAIKTEGLEPSAPATVEIVTDEPLVFSVLVPLQPVVDLGDYKSLRVAAIEPAETTDAEVEDVIESLRNDAAVIEPVARPALLGDVVLVNLEGRLDGRIVFEDRDLLLALSQAGAEAAHLPYALIEALAGAAPGQELDVHVSYPADWPQADLAGQSVHYTGLVTEVSERRLPELDDEFARQAAEVATLAELPAYVRGVLERRRAASARIQTLDAALAALADSARIEFPPGLLDEEIVEEVERLRSNIEDNGLRWERWLELEGMSEDELADRLEPRVSKGLTHRLALRAFIAAEGISVDPAEMASMLPGRFKPGKKGKGGADTKAVMDAYTRIFTERAFDRLIAITTGRPYGAEAASPAADDGASSEPVAATSIEER